MGDCPPKDAQTSPETSTSFDSVDDSQSSLISPTNLTTTGYLNLLSDYVYGLGQEFRNIKQSQALECLF